MWNTLYNALTHKQNINGSCHYYDYYHFILLLSLADLEEATCTDFFTCLSSIVTFYLKYALSCLSGHPLSGQCVDQISEKCVILGGY